MLSQLAKPKVNTVELFHTLTCDTRTPTCEHDPKHERTGILVQHPRHELPSKTHHRMRGNHEARSESRTPPPQGASGPAGRSRYKGRDIKVEKEYEDVDIQQQTQLWHHRSHPKSQTSSPTDASQVPAPSHSTRQATTSTMNPSAR